MALDNTMNVEITASVDGLKRGLVKAEKGIKGFEASTERMGKTTDKLGKSVGGNAVPALTSFSQVVQDAPYGIRGVANNITQLTSQFGYLSKSAGGTKAALKSMLASLAGPGGILLVVSLVTSALVAYGDKLGGASKETNKLIDATKDLIGAAKQELSTYQSLVAIAKDNNRSLEDRRKALAKVNEISGKYIGNLDLESINSDKASQLTDKYSEALLRQAKIKGLQSRISELYAKQFEIESKAVTESLTTWNKLRSAVVGVVAGQNSLAKTSFDVSQGFEDQNKALADGANELDKLKSKLTGLLSEDISLDGIFTSTKGGGSKGIKRVIDDTVAAFDKARVKIKPIADDFGTSIASIPDKFLNNIAKFQLMEDALLRFNDNANAIIQGTITSTFENLGSSIGEAIATGGNVFQAIGETIIQGLGKFIGQMGKLLIEYGTMAVVKGKLDLAIASGGPVAIGAGLAAIAVGTALAAIGSAIGNFASSGGSNSLGSDYSSSGSSNYGSSISYGGSSGGGTVVFEIAGTKLVGVLTNTLNENTALSGTLSVQ